MVTYKSFNKDSGTSTTPVDTLLMPSLLLLLLSVSGLLLVDDSSVKSICIGAVLGVSGVDVVAVVVVVVVAVVVVEDTCDASEVEEELRAS